MDWRSFFRTAKIIVITVAVTSLFWVIVGFWLLGADASPPAKAAREAVAEPGTNRLLVPVLAVAPSQLTDTFTQARAGGQRVHDAIDIAAPLGTPVIAAAPGRVEKLFVSEDGGNTVYQRSADGTLIYYYAHLDRYAQGLAEGQQLRAGDRIGTVGFSGNANPQAPHLHFAIKRVDPAAKWYDPGPAINPYPLLTQR